jgi:hypothetical protein
MFNIPMTYALNATDCSFCVCKQKLNIVPKINPWTGKPQDEMELVEQYPGYKDCIHKDSEGNGPFFAIYLSFPKGGEGRKKIQKLVDENASIKEGPCAGCVIWPLALKLTEENVRDIHTAKLINASGQPKELQDDEKSSDKTKPDVAPPVKSDIEDKLEKLKTLLDKGLITPEEYDKKKTELLEKF